MHEQSDVQLLREFADRGDEAAFGEIVARHTELVYSAALRQVESSAAASDIAQSVFTDLARKAGKLAHGNDGCAHRDAATVPNSLAGWLHRATRYAALNYLRDARRRLSNERQAMEQLLANSEPNADWEQIRPVLDEALDALGDEDREALLLRYFKNQDFRAVGLVLGVSDDAAQKRASRAVERLREFFSKRNVTIGASGLVALISANAVQSAPVGLAAVISAAALLTGTAVTTSTAIAVTKTIAMTTLQKVLVTATVAVLAGAGIYEAHQAAQLREQNQTLQQQQASLADQLQQLQRERDDSLKEFANLAAKTTPRMPAPKMQMTVSTTNAVEDLQSNNIYTRFNEKQPKLNAGQVEAYLKANGRKASSLLAAYRTSGDPALLKEAMEKYPNDPQVAFEAAISNDLTSDEKRQWVNTFKQTAPDNALANYLSAINDFNSGQVEQGLQELTAASGKQLDDYTLSRAQTDDEAYLSAGYSAAEAERIADSSLMVSQLPQVKQLGVDLVDLAKAYNQSGDSTSAQATFQMAINLGQRFADPSTDPMLINQLVGMAIEKIAFTAMDPNSPYGNSGQTVQDQLNQINQNRAAITELTQQAVPLLPSLSDQDILNYENRRRAFGEVSALQWVVGKYGQR